MGIANFEFRIANLVWKPLAFLPNPNSKFAIRNSKFPFVVKTQEV